MKITPPSGKTLRSLLPHARFRGMRRRLFGGPYARPRRVGDLSKCYFYHDMDIPGYGSISGAWDLRGREDVYLGGVAFRGKRVLEMGTATGALGFWMERQGAEMVCYDLSPAHDWDIVPYARIGAELPATVAERKAHIAEINNAWWLAHRAYGSRARLVHGEVYDVPAAIGPVDIVTFGAILLHLRDPFRALQAGTRLAYETAVVVDLVPPETDLDAPMLRFVPDPATGQPRESWWYLSPNAVVQMLGVLGFGAAHITYHTQKHDGKDMSLYPVVARRTHGTVRP
jgi:hypothetical protein